MAGFAFGSGVSIDTKGGEITMGKINVGSGGNVIMSYIPV